MVAISATFPGSAISWPSPWPGTASQVTLSAVHSLLGPLGQAQSTASCSQRRAGLPSATARVAASEDVLSAIFVGAESKSMVLGSACRFHRSMTEMEASAWLRTKAVAPLPAATSVGVLPTGMPLTPGMVASTLMSSGRSVAPVLFILTTETLSPFWLAISPIAPRAPSAQAPRLRRVTPSLNPWPVRQTGPWARAKARGPCRLAGWAAVSSPQETLLAASKRPAAAKVNALNLFGLYNVRKNKSGPWRKTPISNLMPPAFHKTGGLQYLLQRAACDQCARRRANVYVFDAICWGAAQ